MISIKCNYSNFFLMARQPQVGLGLPSEVFRSYADTSHSVALLRTSGKAQRPEPDNKQQSQDRDIHAPPPKRNSNPQSQKARDRRPTP